MLVAGIDVVEDSKLGVAEHRLGGIQLDPRVVVVLHRL